MSIEALNWANSLADRRLLPAGPGKVLQVVADFADADGHCWPSQAKIAPRAFCNVRSVRSHLRWLEEHALLTRRARYVIEGAADDGAGAAHRTTDMIVLALGAVPVGPQSRQGVEEGSSGGGVLPSQTIPANLAGMAFRPLAAEGPGGECPSQPIPARFAGIGPIPANDDSPGVEICRYVIRKDPPLEPPDQAWAGACGRGGPAGPEAGGCGGAGAPGSGEVSEDGGLSASWAVARECLPEGWWSRLDAPGVVRVAAELGRRRDGGWSPAELRGVLGASALPGEVRSLAGLVLARLRGVPVRPPDGPSPVGGGVVRPGLSSEGLVGRKPPGWVSGFVAAAAAEPGLTAAAWQVRWDAAHGGAGS